MRSLALLLVVSLPALADIAPPEIKVVPVKAEPAAPPAEAAPVVAPVPVVAPAPVAAPVAAEHPGGNENAPGMKDMPQMGVIQGGWAYVYAAWGAGILGLVGYAASLFLRKSSDLPPGAP
jgi:hypothetical protein